MRLLHTADLHLGKKVNGFNLLEDQRFVLRQIVNLVKTQKPDALLIAGDLYDSGYPPEGAVSLLDDFLTELASLKCETYIISGNHDAARRLAFASKLLDTQGIHFITSLEQSLKAQIISDKQGKSLALFSLPYFTYLDAQRLLNDHFENMQEATEALLAQIREDKSQADLRVLMAHLFVTYAGTRPETSDSERINLGTIENVDASLFEDFDYCALGHVHRPQKIYKDTIRYSGSPLMYSFSELGPQKHLVQIDFDEACLPKLSFHPLLPLHEMRQIKGYLKEVIAQTESEESASRQDYVQVILRDEFEPHGALDTLRELYPNLMILSFDNKRTQAMGAQSSMDRELKEADYLKLFEEFYAEQNGMDLSAYQKDVVKESYNQAVNGKV